MKSIVKNGGLVAAVMLLLAGCGGTREGGPAARTVPMGTGAGVTDGPVVVGDPYTISGVTYTPADVPDYDDVGYAGWLGTERAGQPTANGETYDPAGMTAAHKTLPLPSYVEVTALDTGRTILVRVNDRGPMVSDRLIDLSRGAVEQLGLGDGVAAVRVRRTNPPAAERAQLRAGKPVPERIATPDSLLTILRNKAKGLPVPKAAVAATSAAVQAGPAIASGNGKPGDDRFIVEGPAAAKAAPATKPAAASRSAAAVLAGKYVVQVGAFSSESRANAAANSVSGHVAKAGKLWRVRVGPFANDADARSALAKVKAKGFRDALVQRDR